MMELLDFVRSASKVPFKMQGRDHTGWDCYGLVYVGLREVFGVEVPKYIDGYENVMDLAKIGQVIDTNKQSWRKVESPQPGDVIVLQPRRFYCHVGLMVDQHRFLHTEQNNPAIIEDYRKAIWRDRVDGFYRYEQ